MSIGWDWMADSFSAFYTFYKDERYSDLLQLSSEN